MEPFSLRMRARWGDMDQNAHLANSAFLDMAVDVRMSFFLETGFPPTEFARRRVGPVVRRDEVEYLREVHLLEDLTVTMELAGMSADGSRFRMANKHNRCDYVLFWGALSKSREHCHDYAEDDANCGPIK